jgi:hypothetical protein
MPPIVSQSTTNLLESSNINIGGSVAARIARNQPSSTTSTSTSSSSTANDDGYGEYRNLCELRIRRLERYKKAKSFCSLDCGDSINYGNLATAAQSSTSTSNIACANPSPLHSASTSTCSTLSSSDSSLSPTNSTQNLTINTRPVSTSSAANHSAFESQVELLKQKMISLMENDVSLLQKLVALGETIQELKSSPSNSNNNKPSTTTNVPTKPIYRPRSLHRTSSETSLSSSYADEEDDDFHPLESGENTFSKSMSAITRLYVDNKSSIDGGAEDEDDEIQPNVQYFSRKNSVLRIPIPPRSSNRMLGNSKRALRRPSQLLRQCPPRLLNSSEDSGHSSSSDSTTPPLQASPKIFNDGTSTVSSTLSSSTSSTRHPLYDIQECGGGIKSSRRSNTSVDSGIRDSANSSPTNFVTNVKMMG